MVIRKRFVLFSLDTPDSKAGTFQHTMIKNILRDENISFTEVFGCYAGIKENSYMAVIETDDKLKVIRSIAWQFLQEAILIVEEDRVAYICYNKDFYNTKNKLGAWVNITAEEATNLNAWTLLNNQYYTVK